MRLYKSSRAKGKGFHRKSEFQMIWLICGGHAVVHQHGVSIQNSINLHETF